MDDSLQLLARWRDGDQQAATDLYQTYASRLIALARNHLSTKVAARFDAEDVVQSVCRSFFARARDGQFVIQASDELWRLLVAITLHKVRRAVKHHQRGKRGVDQETTGQGIFGVPAEVLARAPAPEEAVALADLLEAVMRGCRPLDRQIIELRLQGCTVEDIAAHTRRSERTIWRVLERTRQEWDQYDERGTAP
jgi:RNA polymerase sigma factor (sigma-70 family)